MKVQLLAHSQLSEEFYDSFDIYNERLNYDGNEIEKLNATNGQVIALSAIRTCYSPDKPSEIVKNEGVKYFSKPASDGKGGTDAERLMRHIVNSGHTSTLEHLNYTFAIEGVSRSLLAQLTRHRHLSFSVQSQRYVKLESESKSGGFEYVTPPKVDDKSIPNYQWKDDDRWVNYQAQEIYDTFMRTAQDTYNKLRKAGVPAEDARYVLPNAARCNLVLTGNLRSLLDFCTKRESQQAQWEIRDLAGLIKNEVIKVEPWTKHFFDK